MYLVALFVVLALIGCASAPAPQKQEVKAVAKFEIVDHKNATLGGDVPAWASMDEGDLEQDPKFEKFYVFRFEENGKSLDGVRTWANNFAAQSEIAKLINTRVQQKFAGAQVGDKDKVESYFENVVKTLADAKISGYRKFGDYWVLKRYLKPDGSPDREEYVYYVLYTIEKGTLDKLIQDAIAGTAAKTEEEKTAQQRVKEIFAEGL